MKKYNSKLPYTDPHHPEVTARVLEMIQSMTPEEAKAFLEYRKPGIPEYWFGEPIDQNGHIQSQKEDPEPSVAISHFPK